MSVTRRWLVVLSVLALVAAACGGGDSDEADANGGGDGGDGGSEVSTSVADAPGLPDGCDNGTPLQVTVDGFPELSGPFEVAGGVALPFPVLPGDGPLVDLSDEELAAAVEASDLVGYTIAATDFPYSVEDAGSFYGLFSTPTLPEQGGTTVLMTVIPPAGPLAAGSVVEVGTPLSYADELQTTAVSTGVFLETNRVDEAPFLGGDPADFTGSVEVLAITGEAVCLSWSTSSPLFGEDGAFVTVSGVVSAPLLELRPRNSMG